ncbi:MAG: hypothetical protein WA837_17480, partial [Xanthobacteraceae bacterium]
MRNMGYHPALPSWLWAEEDATMQVDDRILNCTVFLGRPLAHGFSADGTGFFIGLEIEGMRFHYIVTCRHVVRPTISARDPTPNDESIWVRINRAGDKPPTTIETRRSDWLYPTNRRIDVCIYPFDLRRYDANNDLDMTVLNAGEEHDLVFTEKLKRQWGLSLGDEIFIVGCFVGQIGERKNIPVIRVGSIAAKPDEPIGGVSHQNP